MARRREPNGNSAPLPRPLAFFPGLSGDLDDADRDDNGNGFRDPPQPHPRTRPPSAALHAAHLVASLPGSIARRSTEVCYHISASAHLLGCEGAGAGSARAGAAADTHKNAPVVAAYRSSPGKQQSAAEGADSRSPRGRSFEACSPRRAPSAVSAGVPASTNAPLPPRQGASYEPPDNGVDDAAGLEAEGGRQAVVPAGGMGASETDLDPRGSLLRGRLSADGAAARFAVMATHPACSEPQTQPQRYPLSRFRSLSQRTAQSPVLAQTQHQEQLQRGLRAPHREQAPPFSDLQRAVPGVSVSELRPSSWLRDWGLGAAQRRARRARYAAAAAAAASAPQLGYESAAECEEDSNSRGGCAGACGGADSVGDAGNRRAGVVAEGSPRGGVRAQRSGPLDGESPGLFRRLMRALVGPPPRGRQGRVSCDGRGGGTGGGGGGLGGGGDILRASSPLGDARQHRARHWRSWGGWEGISGVGADIGDGDGGDDGEDADAALQELQLQRRDSRILHRARLGLGPGQAERPRSVLPTPRGVRKAAAPAAALGIEAGGAGNDAGALPPSGLAASAPPSPGSSACSPAAGRQPPGSPSPSAPASLHFPSSPCGPAAPSPTRPRHLFPSEAALTPLYGAWGVPSTPPGASQPPRSESPATATTSRDLGDSRQDKGGTRVHSSSIAALRARLASARRSPGSDLTQQAPIPLSLAALTRDPSSPLAQALREPSRCLSEPVAVLATTRTVKRLAVGVPREIDS